MVLCGSVKEAELWKPTLGRIQNGGQRQNFVYGCDIFRMAEVRDIKFGVCIDCEV